MREVLYEESINPTNLRLRKAVSIICTVIKAISIVVVVIFIFGIIYGNLFSIINVAFAAFTYCLFWFIQERIYYCVDCVFVSGSTRLTKVLNYKRRKLIIIFDYNEVEQVGKTTSESFEKLYTDKSIKKIFATPNKYAENAFYVYIKQGLLNCLIILDCKEDYLKHLISYTGRRVIEKDYK